MKNKLSRRVTAGFVPVLITLSLTGCGQSPSKPANVVATYKGGYVTKSQLDLYLHVLGLFNPQANTSTNAAKTQILQQYIVIDRLLSSKATKAGFKGNTTAIQSEIAQLKDQVIQQAYNHSTQSFNAKMKSLNLTDTDLNNTIGTEIAVEQYVTSLVPSSAVKSYYNQHLTSYTTSTQRGILVKTKAQAEKIYQMLKTDHSTANWDTLAKKYSQDPGSKNNGGLYSNQPASNWVPQYAHAVTSQPIGQVGQPFDTTYGWFVVEVLNRQVEPLQSVQSQIKNQMLSDTTSKYSMSNVLSQTQKEADIKVTLPSSSTSSK